MREIASEILSNVSQGSLNDFRQFHYNALFGLEI